MRIRLRAFLSRLWTSFAPSRHDTAAIDEMAEHLEHDIARHVASGLSPQEARRRALANSGGLQAARERYRDQMTFPFITALLHDLGFGGRVLRRNPGFAVAAVLPLAFALGTTATAFSIVDAVLLRPLPYPDPDRIVHLGEALPDTASASWADRTIHAETLDAWQRDGRTLDRIASFHTPFRTLDTPSERVRLHTAAVNASFFDILGIAPAEGRYFREDEEPMAASQPMAVLSHTLWHRHFQGDAAIVGQTIVLDDQPHLVIGVAPAPLRFPRRQTELWTLLPRTGSAGSAWGGDRAIARLAPGVTPDMAAVEGTAIARRAWAVTHADNARGGEVQVHVDDLATEATAPVRRGLLLLIGATLVVLCAATTHVAHLLVIQTLRRRRELAVRAALGASVRRIACSLFMTSLWIGTIAGSIGLLIAAGAHAILPTIVPPDFPRLDGVVLTLRTVLALGGASIGAILVCGAVLAWHVSRMHVLAPLGPAQAETGRFGRMGRRRGSMAMLAGEVAFSCALLIIAGLLGRSFLNLMTTDPGYEPSGALSAQVSFPPSTTQPERRDVIERLLARLRARPSVTAAGVSNALPLEAVKVVFQLRESYEADGGVRADLGVISPGYLEALSMRLIRGRAFDENDRDGAPRAAIVNDAFVRRYYPDQDVIGLDIPSGTPDQPFTVVGVVADVRLEGPTKPADPAFYLPYLQREQTFFNRVNVVARTTGDPIALAPVLRDVVRSTDARLALAEITTPDRVLSDYIARPRLYAAVLVVCALVATAIVAIGLFGVLAHGVNQRRREVAIRVAVGATPASVARLLLRDGATVLAAGIAIGTAAGMGAGRLIGSLLHGTTPSDPLTFVAAPLVLALVATIAAVVPIRAALKADTVAALRAE